MVGKEDPLPPDHLFPNLWSATAYDSFKYSRLQKVALGLLDKLVAGAGHVVAAPIHAAMAVARQGGRPLDDIMKEPEHIHGLLQAFTRPDTTGRGEFLPHDYHRPDPPSTHHHKKGALMNKAQFLQRHMGEFRAKEAQVRSEITESIEKQAFLGGVRKAIFGEPSTTDRIVDAVKSIGGAAGSFKDLFHDPNLASLGSKAQGFMRDHPIATGLGAAGTIAAGMGLHRMHQQGQMDDRHHAAFHEAMNIFPELQTEDPRKMQLLHSSAVQVAPHMSTNPLLLGTWMKGLAKGFSGTHLSTEDLKRLQDLEVHHVGGPENRQGFLSTAKNVAGVGAGLAGIMSHMSKGQGH